MALTSPSWMPRNSTGAPTDRPRTLGKAQQVVLDHRVWLLESLFPGVEEMKYLVLGSRLTVAGLGRQEGQAACDDRGQRLGIDLDAVGAELDVPPLAFQKRVSVVTKLS
jgi:hypothetical protein